MPGFCITNLNNEIELNNLYQERCHKDKIYYNKYCVSWNTLFKFMEDKVFEEDKNYIILLEGIILNKKELFIQYEATSMKELISKMLNFNGDDFFRDFRGSFSGGVYLKKEDKWICYTDQLGTKPVYYYIDDNCNFICGTQLNYITDTMKANHLRREADSHGLSCMMIFGSFVDDCTGVKQVKRLYPGDYLIWKKNSRTVKNYYSFRTVKEKSKTEQEYIELLDASFSKAVDRMIKKDIEYGYKSIIDISGGVDSRMIAYTASKLKYENAIMICYSQSEGREYKIAQRVANDLKYDFYYKSLDNGSCVFSLEENVLMNNGSAIYDGITGGKSFLEILDSETFGIEFTGLLGDIYDGSMVVVDGNEKPYIEYARFRSSTLLPYDKHIYSDSINRFQNHELFWYYTRGMICGMSSFPIRQNYIEPLTPFGDIEFVETYLSIPWDIRVKRKLLSRWMVSKYPQAAKIPYAATGISIEDEFTFCGKFKKLAKLFNQEIHRHLHLMHKGYAMNPYDYWCKKNPEIMKFAMGYFEENINSLEENLRKKVEILMKEETSYEDKSLALTVLAYSKLFLDE